MVQLKHSGKGDEAEIFYRKSLEYSRQHGTRSYELRTTICLARLRCEQGKRQEAHDLLAPVYDWFTEGFDTADLKEARALLNEIV